MEIIYDQEQANKSLIQKFEEVAKLCLDEEAIPSDYIEISLTFATEEEIREINRDYRDVDSVTDVLSFPQYDREDLDEEVSYIKKNGKSEMLLPIGDVVICENQAKAQAKEFGHSEDREFMYLFAHSIFHLLGYDHMEEDEKAIMRAKEEKIMIAMGLERE